MSFTITCHTLFDITATGVVNRHRPVEDEEMHAWLYKRNTQCNFDTVLQAISLRSQPEIISAPVHSRFFRNKGRLIRARIFIAMGSGTLTAAWVIR